MEPAKTALVTGAARRIGLAIALDLAKHGWAVGIHCRQSLGDAEAVLREIEAFGGRAAILQADLSDESQARDLVPRTADELGQVGLLVNNASVFERDEVDTADRASWDLHMETNLRAPFVLSQAMAAGLSADAHGVIVNIIDERVWNLTPHFVSYTVSKAGLWTLTRTLALALAPRIRVNGIGPGPTLPSPRQTEQQFERQCAALPLGRGASLQEICDAVRFILIARSMTGQMIALDGGQHLGWAPPGGIMPDSE